MIGLKVAKTICSRDGQWKWLRFVPFGLGVIGCVCVLSVVMSVVRYMR